MKTYKEFEPYVKAKTKQTLFQAQEVYTAKTIYQYGIDIYENKLGNIRYYAIVTRNNELLDWNNFTEYRNAMEFIINYLH